jgi:hypothetical protein
MSTETPGKLNITAEQAREILFEDNDDFKIISDEIIENSRWSILRLLTVQRISDGAFFRASYSVGATEQQDERPWEYSSPDFYEVIPEQVVVTKYVRKYPRKKVESKPAPAAPSGI